jgi:hypothetical protein
LVGYSRVYISVAEDNTPFIEMGSYDFGN